MISRETSRYRSIRTGRYTPCGQRRHASEMGMAEWMPNLRASYEQADTTPRCPGAAPTMTGLPRSDGSSRCSTEA